MCQLVFNRALHPDDYLHPELRAATLQVRDFETRLRREEVPFRKDHQHRVWEYANIVRQLEALGVLPPARVLDTGSGGSYFPALLASLGYRVTVSDSMAYGDCTPTVAAQCRALGVSMPVLSVAVEAMDNVGEGDFDVTLCVSVIEHLEPARYEQGWSELERVTKPGGYVMLTSDYFADLEAWKRSPFRHVQHNLLFPEVMMQLLDSRLALVPVGGIDLTYRGDFVHTYSFVNLCFRRVA